MTQTHVNVSQASAVANQLHPHTDADSRELFQDTATMMAGSFLSMCGLSLDMETVQHISIQEGGFTIRFKDQSRLVLDASSTLTAYAQAHDGSGPYPVFERQPSDLDIDPYSGERVHIRVMPKTGAIRVYTTSAYADFPSGMSQHEARRRWRQQRHNRRAAHSVESGPRSAD